jgi:alpha-tubulin suppressor-like RCC1 family protein
MRRALLAQPLVASVAAARVVAVSLLAVVAGCREATQITIEVSTNVPCSSWNGAAISVGVLGAPLETKPPATTSAACDASGHVGAVVVIPSGSSDEAVAFRVIGATSGATLDACSVDAGAANCIVARRALNFIPHESLSVAVPLRAACEGVACDAYSTCVEGTCRPATLPDPSACATQTCGEGSLLPPDGGAPDATLPDAGGPDAAHDANASGGDGGSDAAIDGAPLDGQVGGCAAGGCAIALGEDHTCAIANGGVLCWGDNNLQELGRDSTATMGPPAPVLDATKAPLSGVTGIVSGWATTCAFVGGGGVWCWGDGASLGLATSVGHASPVQSFASASQVSLGYSSGCWVDPSGVLWCHDDGDNGAIADGNPSDAGTAYKPTLPAPYAQIYAGRNNTCVIRASDRSLWCVGANGIFETDPNGGPGNVKTGVRVPIPLDAGVAEVALQELTTCVRTVDGHIYCWGQDDVGQTGADPTTHPTGIDQVLLGDGGTLGGAVQLAAGASHGCARLASGELACWGDDSAGQLGRGVGSGYAFHATLVVDGHGGTFAGAVVVGAQGNHTCARTQDGSMWCWGQNTSGQLGLDAGDTANRAVPTRVF